MELGLKQPKLNDIEEYGDNDRRMEEVISAWLNMPESLKPCWQSLVDALKHAGEGGVAAEIEKKLSKTQATQNPGMSGPPL